MAFVWVDRVDGEDDYMAADINSVAHAVEDLDVKFDTLENDFVEIFDELHSYAQSIIAGETT